MLAAAPLPIMTQGQGLVNVPLRDDWDRLAFL
jgi:hypothetical protein